MPSPIEDDELAAPGTRPAASGACNAGFGTALGPGERSAQYSCSARAPIAASLSPALPSASKRSINRSNAVVVSRYRAGWYFGI